MKKRVRNDCVEEKVPKETVDAFTRFRETVSPSGASAFRLAIVKPMPSEALLPISPASQEAGPPDPEIESADGVDLTLIRWTLSLTPLQRLELLQDWVDGLAELRRGRIPKH